MMTKPISLIIKEKREQTGTSIEEISEKTFIPPKFLRMIEEEKWYKFPSKTHLKGFLKTELSFLHIPVEILKEYPEIFSESGEQQTDPPEKKQIQSGLKELYYGARTKKISFGIIIFLIIIGSLMLFISIFQLKTPPKPIGFKTILSKKTIPVNGGVRTSFSLEATENVWILAEDNGKIILEKTLKKGEKKKLKGKRIFIRIGNAGGLLIIHNGKSFGPFGKSGEVKNIIVDKKFFIPNR